MPDAHANFAVSTVLAAPSPATTGLSLGVQGGDGGKFPTPPFNALVWPVNATPSSANAEIVRVTAGPPTTDTFTIVRMQEGTSARTIQPGDQIIAGITAKSLTDIETALTQSAPFQNGVMNAGDALVSAVSVNSAGTLAYSVAAANPFWVKTAAGVLTPASVAAAALTPALSPLPASGLYRAYPIRLDATGSVSMGTSSSDQSSTAAALAAINVPSAAGFTRIADVVVQAALTNQILNPNFDYDAANSTTPAGWTFGATSGQVQAWTTHQVQTGYHSSGAQSLRLTTPTLTPSGNYSLATANGPTAVPTQGISGVAVTPGQVVTARGDISIVAVTNAGAQFTINFYDANGTFISSAFSAVRTTTGVLTVSGNAPATAAYATLELAGVSTANNGTADFYIDSVQLVAGSAQTTYFDGDTGGTWSGTAGNSTSNATATNYQVTAVRDRRAWARGAQAIVADSIATTQAISAGAWTSIPGAQVRLEVASGLVMLEYAIYGQTSANPVFVGVSIDGGTPAYARSGMYPTATFNAGPSHAYIHSGLAPGSHLFTLQAFVPSGTFTAVGTGFNQLCVREQVATNANNGVA